MVKNQGFGCMGFSAFYSSRKNVTTEKAKSVIERALERGVTLFNSATFYGELNEVGFGSNLRLLKKCFEGIDRSKYELMVKVGMDTRCPVEKTGSSWVMKMDEKGLREDVNYALEQLGTDYIDIIVLCRVPKGISIEESMEAMKKLVEEGKARHIGLSEASANTIRRANKVHPVYCIEQEWSLWARDIEKDIVPTCRELGVKIVAYSPLGRGFLTGTIEKREGLENGDYRLFSPKFSEDNFDHNLQVVTAANAIAKKNNISLGQLSLAWLHAQGEDVIPIPGTTSVNHFDENYDALSVQLSSEDIQELNRLFSDDAIKGERYPGNHNTFHEN